MSGETIVWKDVKGYEGIYRVNNKGQVQNVLKGNYLKQFETSGGYLHVYLYKDHKRKIYKAHRVVCEAFNDNPHKYPQVNHINMNKQDNRPENLEWCTQSYNIRHSFQNGGREHNKQKLLEANHREVWCCDLEGKELKLFYSLSEAARQTGCNVSNISACCHGRIKSIGGFKWKLKVSEN